MIDATCDACGTTVTLPDLPADRTCPNVPCAGYLVLGQWWVNPR